MMSCEITESKLKAIQERVVNELRFATQRYPMFASEHEGYAIILEEIDELWEAVRLKQSDPTRRVKCTKEAMQVAAMAIRFIHDLGDI